ncbi:MAG: ammonium transporter [Pseudomonadota bacterium]
MTLKSALAAFGAVSFAVFAAPAFAQDAAAPPAPADDATIFVFNTMLFLIGGMVVMFMAAGFCMLEVGLVRTKNAATICVKNLALYSVAGLMFWLLGYNLLYGVEDGGFIGSFAVWGADDAATQSRDGLRAALDEGTGYASGSDWFFQMVFVATAASIVSGTLAERIRLWPFLAFVAVLTGVIYPIQASWEWGGGWLNAEWYANLFGAEFSDFAGSTLVHATGGFAALVGALALGPRTGKYSENGAVRPMPGSSLPLATLGTFILWLGWFGFNGGSQLALGTISDAIDVSTIFINTNIAAAAGVMAAMAATQMLFGKVDLTVALNGAIGGLVSITAEPLAPAIWQAAMIGAVGGIIVTLTVPVLDALKIDDVVGAIPAHLFCGAWGTLIVPFSNADASYVAQAVGLLSIGLFVTTMSAIVWFALKFAVGVRASAEDEAVGLDVAELGLEAYPEFAVR